MSRRKILRPTGTFKAVVYAVLVHLAVILILLISFRWSFDTSTEEPKIVKAVVVKDDQAIKARKEEARKRKVEAEKQRRAEERRKKAALEKKKKQQAELKRRAEEKKRKAAAAEKKRRAEEKRKKEAERRRQEAEQALARQLEAEEQARIRAEREARALTEAEKYKALIKRKVSRNWARPPGSRKGLQVVVMVKLVPGGEVIQATVVRSSGDPIFDRSVENAVYKATPLPIPEDADLFEYFREIEFLFNPES